MLKLTTDTLVGSGIGIDLVCLSPMPLHSVPLFKYKTPRSVSSLKQTTNERYESKRSAEGFNEVDDKTPRQNQAIFGSMMRSSPAAPPPILPTEPAVDSSSGSDDWRYAMPHWLDISFWSGPSDPLIENLKPKKQKKSTSMTKSHKKVSTFALRCRMYELQMMGIMENELGDICVPYLEEDPLYPHRLREHLENAPMRSERESIGWTTDAPFDSRFDSRRVTFTDEQLDQTSALQRSWMESYDDNVFSPLMDRRPHFEDPKLRITSNVPVKVGSPDQLPDETFLSASFRSVGRSLGKTARPTPEGNFHQLMREHSRDADYQSPRGGIYRTPDTSGQGAPRADVMYRQMALTRDSKRPSFHQRGNSGDSLDQRQIDNLHPK